MGVASRIRAWLDTPPERDPTPPWQLNPEVPEYAEDDVRTELRERYRAWKGRRPWCWLPVRLRVWAFVWWGIGDVRRGARRLQELERPLEET